MGAGLELLDLVSTYHWPRLCSSLSQVPLIIDLPAFSPTNPNGHQPPPSPRTYGEPSLPYCALPTSETQRYAISKHRSLEVSVDQSFTKPSKQIDISYKLCVVDVKKTPTPLPFNQQMVFTGRHFPTQRQIQCLQTTCV